MNYLDGIELAEIMVKKVVGNISPREEERLQRWLDSSLEHREMYEAFVSGQSFAERKRNFGHLKYEKTIGAIHEKIRRKVRRRLYMKISSVAAVLLVAVLSTVIIFSLRTEKAGVEPILPVEGKHYAFLSVDDGRKVVLKENDTGTAWKEHVKEKAGENVVAEEKVQMIRVEVPRGSEYWLRLNDSTEVWLNSETVLTYPDRFAEDKREVTLRGEAFFKVRTNPTRPFEVRTDENLQIWVTGTELNVRDYADEQFLKVTLLKGGVHVGNDSIYKILSPSEQAVFDRETGDIEVVELDDPSICVAWREGMFAFEGEPIGMILAAMAQWYDVEFVIENKVATPGGSVTFHAMRDDKVEELLCVLQSLIDFKYRIEGKKIYIRF